MLGSYAARSHSCLDKEILCKKLALYGLDEKSVKWFGSFLSERSQIVKIADSLSDSLKLNSGVPQGGIISPLLYIIYVADLQDWLKYVLVTTYADDTSTSIVVTLRLDFIRMVTEVVTLLLTTKPMSVCQINILYLCYLCPLFNVNCPLFKSLLNTNRVLLRFLFPKFLT